MYLHKDTTSSGNHLLFAPKSSAGGSVIVASNGVHSLSVTQTRDAGGQAGTTIPGTGAGGSGLTFAANSADQTVFQSYRLPQTSTTDYLYAPTLKGGGSACLEASTIYTNNAAPSVGFWDFCIPGNSSFHNSKTIDANFVSTYVRNLGDGQPRYSVEIVFAGDGAWHGLLYNYTVGYWEDVYDSKGNNGSVNNGAGWDMFETHFFTAGSTCRQIPNISSINYKVQPGSTLVLVNPSTVQGAAFFSYGDCFNENGSGGVKNTGTNPFVLNRTTPDSSWSVTGGHS